LLVSTELSIAFNEAQLTVFFDSLYIGGSGGDNSLESRD